jgi:peptidyl-prolyl cis-trans isomerase D
MLQNIRERITGKFALAILVIIGSSFLFFGINSNFIAFGYAAKVNDKEIPIPVFENAYRDQLLRFEEQGIDIPDDVMQLVKEGVLDALIRDTVVDIYLEDNGYRVSDAIVTDFIQRQLDFRSEGKFSKEIYYAWLNQRVLDPSQFEESQRKGIQKSQLQRGIGATSFVTPSEYRRYLNLYFEQRQVDIIEVDIAKIAANISIDNNEIQMFYDENIETFIKPESVDFKYIEIDRNNLSSNVEVTDEELQQHYDNSSFRFLQEEKRQAQHILIPFGDDEISSNNLAMELTNRAQSGESFNDLAKQYSQDGGTASRGGDLGMLLKSQLPGGLSETIFSIEEGEVEGPLKTDFGFHVVKLMSIEMGGSLPMDSIRSELETEIKLQKSANVFTDLERSISDALFDLRNIDSLAENLDLEINNAIDFTLQGGEPFGSNQALIDAMFDGHIINEREISEIIELDANRSLVFQVFKHTQSSPQEIGEVSDVISGAIKTEKARQQALQLIPELMEKLANEDAEVSVAAQLYITTSSLVTDRQNTSFDPMINSAIFQVKRPIDEQLSVGTTTAQNGNVVLFNVTEIIPGRPEMIPLAERDAGKIQLSSRSGTSDYAAFVSELEKAVDIVRSQDVITRQNRFE